jgi:hypothetical protein
MLRASKVVASSRAFGSFTCCTPCPVVQEKAETSVAALTAGALALAKGRTVKAATKAAPATFFVAQIPSLG